METWYDALQVFLAVSACLIPFFLLYSTRLRKQPTDQTKSGRADSKAYSKCTSPNCVRCQNYGELNDKLAAKFRTLSQTIEGDLSRIKKAIDENKTDEKLRREAKQQPNIFFLPGLSLVTPFYTDDVILAPDAEIIRNNSSNILREFLEIFGDLQNGDATGWLSNSVPTGDWFVFHLYNQGVKMAQNCERCPTATAILEDLKRFMKGNAFGNAAFSVLQPGTHITEHFGPCNVRIRCHLGLLTPPNCWLKVDGVQQGWTRGQCLLFDDSFRHEAKHGGSTEPRAVFIVDLWHPDITETEMNCLNKLFCLD